MEKTKNGIFMHFKTRMRQKQISQTLLAERIGLSRTTLHKNFKGDTQMLLSTYLKICEVLELDSIELPKELNDKKFSYIKVYRSINYSL